MALEKDLIKSIIVSLEEKKAEDIQVIDISDISSFANYFVIANGSNPNQVQAMADSVEQSLKPIYKEDHKIEGYRKANWVLLDFGNIIIHIFDRPSRDFYKLEQIWKDGRVVPINEL